MKQHITVDQLDELSVEGRGKLANWCFENGYPVNATQDLSKLFLSIGQMVEFLDDKSNLVNSGCHGFKEIQWDGGKELCDALWEACKKVLEKEQ